jgi:predicted membrane protein
MKQTSYAIRGLLGAIVIIMIGVVLAESTRANEDRASQEAEVSATAVLGGYSQRSFSPDFRSAEATAFLGGVDLDFRNAEIEGDEAVVEVFAMMGGVTLRVPPGWVVVQEANAIMGGVDDRTRGVPGENSKRLIVRGTVLMGGLNIRN